MRSISSTVASLIVVCSLTFSSSAQEETQRGYDEMLNDTFMPIAQGWEDFIFTEIFLGSIGIPIVLVLLIVGALFFTIYFRAVNVRYFWTAILIVRGKYDGLDQQTASVSSIVVDGDVQETIRDESVHGEVNHFQALATAVSGTVGLGNIAMVAVAISIGGPGATLWMILAGLLGMSSKFVECTLGVKYREVDEAGRVFGGPMYYLSKGFKDIGNAKLGKVLSIIFAMLCIGASFGGGNAFQSNQAAAQIITRFDIDGSGSGTMIGIVFALLVGIVILGGIKRIAKVTEKVVPFMALIYVLAALFIICSNISILDDTLWSILSEAFTPRATITGGVIAVVIQGFRRAAFSNEAGAGSASIAHAAVHTKHAASEGLVALLEPFIDTVCICTMTAIVIVMFNHEAAFAYGDVIDNQVLIIETGQRLGGVNLTSLAFDTAIPGFSYVLAFAVIMFAFSTMLSWSYYGLQAWKFLFGRGHIADLVYKITFLLFTVLGAAITLDAVIKFSDAMILALVFPNMIGLFFLYPKAAEELNTYKKHIEKTKAQ